MKKIIAGFGALVVAFTLTGCGMSAAEVDTEKPSTSAPEPASEPVEDPAELEEEAPVDDMIFAFGETIEYEDGLGLSVSTAAPYTPSEWASKGEQPNHIVFNVKITNGTDTPYSPGIWGTLASGGGEASEIFDTEQGLDGGPMTPVLPGQTVEWKVGYSVLDPADLTYAVAPSFEYDQAIFTTVTQ